MKKITVVSLCFLLFLGILGLTACVSKEDYIKLEANYSELQNNNDILEANYNELQNNNDIMKSELKTLSLFLAYGRYMGLWNYDFISEEEAGSGMEFIIVQLGYDKILSAWDSYQASITKAQEEERNYVFQAVYFREMDTLMDTLMNKYSLWEYPR